MLIGSTSNPLPPHLYNVTIRDCVWQFLQLLKTDNSTFIPTAESEVCRSVKQATSPSSSIFFILCVNNRVKHYECLWGKKVCPVIPICMIHCISPLPMMAGLLPRLQVWPFRKRINIFALTHGRMTTYTSISWPFEGGGWGETHGYPRNSRLSTEWFLQRLTSVQQSTQPHMVSRLSRAVIRNTYRSSDPPLLWDTCARQMAEQLSYQKDCCTNTALSEVWFPQGCVLKCVSCLYTQVCVFTSETIVQTSLLANMTVMKIARW